MSRGITLPLVNATNQIMYRCAAAFTLNPVNLEAGIQSPPLR